MRPFLYAVEERGSALHESVDAHQYTEMRGNHLPYDLAQQLDSCAGRTTWGCERVAVSQFRTSVATFGRVASKAPLW